MEYRQRNNYGNICNRESPSRTYENKSISRLELMTAIVMSRLAKLLEEAIGGIEAKYFWLDSLTVLPWIRSASVNFKPFVSARIQEIQDTHPRYMDEFRYVPSNMNSADALTKPLSVLELPTWHEGPQLLRQHEDEWPQGSSCEHYSKVEIATRIEGRLENTRVQRRRRVHHVHATDVTVAEITTEERFADVSDWDRLTRHIARGRRIMPHDQNNWCRGDEGYTARALLSLPGQLQRRPASPRRECTLETAKNYCRTRRESLLRQHMGVLPAFRNNPCTPPFAAVVVDSFGPIRTKINRNTTNESSVMIVTCATMRVIHLELTSITST